MTHMEAAAILDVERAMIMSRLDKCRHTEASREDPVKLEAPRDALWLALVLLRDPRFEADK